MKKLNLGVWVLGLLTTVSVFGKPRPPLPPFPEGQAGQWRFNLTNKVEANVADAHGYTLVEGWSGYALQMAGNAARRLLIPSVKEDGRRNVTSGTGTVRFWFAPYWASQSGGGTGPGVWARLLEFGRADETGFWLSLAAQPDGNGLKVSARINGVATTLLDAPVQWGSNQWHQVALVYETNGMQVLVDGNVIGATSAVPPWPASSEWPQYLLSVGAGFQGQELAQGEFDELTTFAGPVDSDYLAWHYGQNAPVAAQGPIIEGGLGGSMMMSSSPPPPGGGGGGSGTNEPPPGVVTGPGLRLTVPVITANVLATSLSEADTNSAYEIFHKLTFASTSKWVRAASGDLGQTNFSVSVPSTNSAFYKAAEIFDTDFDGLSDAYEELISGTSKTLLDSDGDGIPDGKDDANANGVPDYVDYAGLSRAVIWASVGSAFEGSLAGELTIQLPTPAPANNTLVVLHLSKNVDYDGDYYLTKLDGTRVTNDVFFAAGEKQKKLLVHAINDTDQAPRPRKLQAKLESSANYQLDWEMAEVALIDNDLPRVHIFASDNEAGETNGNSGQFRLVREGVLTNALTVQVLVGGSATSGTDFPAIATPITIPASNSAVSIAVTNIDDTVYEGNETVVLTIQPNAAYQIHPTGGNATVTIMENDLPVVLLVGTDLIAAEYAPTTATVTFRRTGNTSQPLIVPFAAGGTADRTNDYQTLPAAVTIPAGSTDGTLTITPLVDALLEQVETVTITVKGSHSYTIGASNSVAVVLDDNNATVTNIVHVKSASVYSPGSINSPAIIEMHRWGRASAAGNVPFVIQTNASGGPQPTTHYLKSGDLGGPNNAPYVIFNAYQSVARMYFSAPNAVPISPQIGGVDFMWNNFVWAIFYLPNNRFVKFEVVTTNAVEGGAQALVRVSRLINGEAITVPIPLSGFANPPALGGPTDHNLPALFSLSLAANTLTAESAIIAANDAAFEGWETLVFNPRHIEQQISVDPKSFMAFLQDNVADPSTLPEGDIDQDGLPDRWELANGFDPLKQGEDSLDADKDGLTNLEEYQHKLSPTNAFTYGAGRRDFAEANKETDLAEFVEIRLRTQDAGKVNNGANCAVCHTVQLRVGDVSHFSARPGASEKSYFLRKGQSYPILLSELVQNLPPVSGDTGNPSTTEIYTAAIVPPTNGPRAYVFTDPQNRLGTNKVWTTSFPPNPTLPIGTVTVARIEVTWTNVPGNAALDANTNAGSGLRVFPDRLNPTDGTARNIVRARVRTIPPMPNQAILLKSFDVDDPFEHPQGNTLEVDFNDATGVRGNDNRGTPADGQLAPTPRILNAAGEAIIDFTVTFQPGDNFRVAALLDTPGAQAHLDRLHAFHTNFPFYVSPNSNAVSGFVGGVSPMLTVWRKLHLEFDSMDPLPASGSDANFIACVIRTNRANYPAAGRSQLTVTYQGNIDDGGDLFELGKLDIPGVGIFRTTQSSTLVGANGQSTTFIEINAAPIGNFAGMSAKLYDDDDRFLNNDPPVYLSNLTLQSPPLAADARSGEFVTNIQSSYATAYILPVDANALGWNTSRRVPFKRNAGLVPTGSSFDANLQLRGTDKAAFWAYSVVLGYQPPLDEDGDPDNEEPTSGLNADDYPFTTADSFCVVWLEAVRDDEWGLVRNTNMVFEAGFSDTRASIYQQAYLRSLYGVIAHEIGHAPGTGILSFLDHLEEGLMVKGAARVTEEHFSPSTLERFRSTLKWTP